MQKKVAHFFIIVVVLLVPLLIPHQVHACSCITPSFSRFSQEFERADTVFMGTVVKVQQMPPAEITSSLDPITYTFQVHAVWKGSRSSQIQVRSANDTASCGAYFIEDTPTIVYAFGSDEDLETYLCTLNHPANSTLLYRWTFFNAVQKVRQGWGLPVREFYYEIG